MACHHTTMGSGDPTEAGNTLWGPESTDGAAGAWAATLRRAADKRSGRGSESETLTASDGPAPPIGSTGHKVAWLSAGQIRGRLALGGAGPRVEVGRGNDSVTCKERLQGPWGLLTSWVLGGTRTREPAAQGHHGVTGVCAVIKLEHPDRVLPVCWLSASNPTGISEQSWDVS